MNTNQKLKSLIARSKIVECIDFMMKDLEGDSYGTNSIAMISAKFHKLQEDRKINIISYAEATLANNRIVNGLINLVNDFYPEEEKKAGEGEAIHTSIEEMVVEVNELEEKTMFYEKGIKTSVLTLKKEIVDYQFKASMDIEYDHQGDKIQELAMQLYAVQKGVSSYEHRLENDLKLEIRQKVRELQNDLSKESLLETANALAALDNSFAEFVSRARLVSGRLLMINLAKDMYQAANRL